MILYNKFPKIEKKVFGSDCFENIIKIIKNKEYKAEVEVM